MRLAKLDELANKGEMRGLSTPSPLRGTRPCLRGRVSYKLKSITAPANCPSETGGRAKRRGWIKTNGKRKGERSKLKGEDGKFISTPSPLRGTRPCLRGRVSYKLKSTTASAYCPPETGGTRSEATEGEDYNERTCVA